MGAEGFIVSEAEALAKLGTPIWPLMASLCTRVHICTYVDLCLRLILNTKKGKIRLSKVSYLSKAKNTRA